MDKLVFDIETVPQTAPLTDIQAEELDKKIKSFLKRNPDYDEEEAKSLIMGTSPYFGEIVCIGLHKVERSLTSSEALIGSESKILKDFWGTIKNFDGLFITYNGIRFDVPFIIRRSMYHNINPTNNNFLNTKPYQRYPHFDVQNLLSDFERNSIISLRLACEFLNIPSPKEEGIKASEVAKYYRQGEIKKIADYCLRDVEATYKLFNFMKSYIYIT